ncbi:hypothetical protein [Apilactobacillus timberlakei]|uniref:hypothetical protein n=1 Tax=Apilactobacillus timberlakei TaxID=2008380 RepID=UPI00112AD46F|nr:hypothetical protein [Apilactobacillus timberlakei]TPR18100.1 hypothetical protein DYZ95_02025 [Apilactobacillus timberlakei]
MQTQNDKSYNAYISFQSILFFLYIMTINNMNMSLQIVSALILLGIYFWGLYKFPNYFHKNTKIVSTTAIIIGLFFMIIAASM